jgi:uncharacterized metal-binding protein YceD (DUF177 family)
MTTGQPRIEPSVFLKINLLNKGESLFRIDAGHLSGPNGGPLADLISSAWLTTGIQIPEDPPSDAEDRGTEERVERTIRSLQAEIRTQPTDHGGPTQSRGMRVAIIGSCDRTLSCVRCLTHFSQRVQFSDNLFAQFANDPEPATGQPKSLHSTPNRKHPEVQLETADLDVYELSPQGLPIDEVLLDLIEGATPDYPICSEGCQGLCQVCGTSLNEGTCGGSMAECPFEHA